MTNSRVTFALLGWSKTRHVAAFLTICGFFTAHEGRPTRGVLQLSRDTITVTIEIPYSLFLAYMKVTQTEPYNHILLYCNCAAHIFKQGLQGLQVHYCVVQVQDGWETEGGRREHLFLWSLDSHQHWLKINLFLSYFPKQGCWTDALLYSDLEASAHAHERKFTDSGLSDLVRLKIGGT